MLPSSGLAPRPRGLLTSFKRLWQRLPTDPNVRALRAAFAPTAHAGRGPLVAIQAIEDSLYFALFLALFRELQAAADARGELLLVRSVNGGVGSGWRAALARSTPFGWILSERWRRLAAGVVDHVGYRSQSLAHPVGDVVDAVRSLFVWRRLRTTDDMLSLHVREIAVGDLIIDSYLRLKPSPRFEPRDRFNFRLIWQAHRDVRRARTYFRARAPQVYLTSYSSYIEHGIAARAAVKESVKVLSFGSFTGFGKQLTAADGYHTSNADRYLADFNALDNHAERLAQAREQLESRLAGGIDTATAYMAVSAYSVTTRQVPAEVKGAVVVFLHDFYDSPHIYPDLVFPDFWAWICCTIDTLRAAGIPFLVKPHPNQVSLSKQALDDLLAAYPGLSLVPTDVSNAQLVDAGMVCGVTVYGTVAHELAYLGVPTIACARHPHHAFGFCRTATTVDDYKGFLRTPAHQPLAPADMREQALKFYYMHNLAGTSDELALRSAFIGFWKACHVASSTAEQLVASFDQLRGLPAFTAFARGLITKESHDASLARP